MNKRIAVSILAVLVILSFPVTLVTASPSLFDLLDGNRIITYPEGAELSFPASEAAWVGHGWSTGPPLYPDKNSWSELNGNERSEFIRTAIYNLYIDDIQVPLRRLQFYNPETDQMVIRYYIQFDANYFEPGTTHKFTGEWYCEVYGVPYHVLYGWGPTYTVYVTFTA